MSSIEPGVETGEAGRLSNRQSHSPPSPNPFRTDLMPRDFLAFLNTFAWVMRWPSPSNPAARALSSSLLTARALSRSAALKNFTTCASAGRTVIRGHLNDPAFYDKMSALLKEILADLKALRI